MLHDTVLSRKRGTKTSVLFVQLLYPVPLIIKFKPRICLEVGRELNKAIQHQTSTETFVCVFCFHWLIVITISSQDNGYSCSNPDNLFGNLFGSFGSMFWIRCPCLWRQRSWIPALWGLFYFCLFFCPVAAMERVRSVKTKWGIVITLQESVKILKRGQTSGKQAFGLHIEVI